MKAQTTAPLVLMIVVIAVIGIPGVGLVQGTAIDEPYEFPVRPGMPEWKDIGTHAEKLEVCQIPEGVLHNMTTSALIETCLDYPLSVDLLAFDTRQIGFETVAGRFNGLQELMGRKDAGPAAVSRYSVMSVDGRRGCDNNCRFRFQYMELILSQDDLLAGLSEEGRRRLLETCYSNHAFMQRQGNFGVADFMSTGRLMSRLLLAEGYGPFESEYQARPELRRLLENGPGGDTSELNTVVRYVEQFLVQKEGKEFEQ